MKIIVGTSYDIIYLRHEFDYAILCTVLTIKHDYADKIIQFSTSSFIIENYFQMIIIIVVLLFVRKVNYTNFRM